jgi:hypothetical protein
MMQNETLSVLRYQVGSETLSEVISVGSCTGGTACTVANVVPDAQGCMVQVGVRVRSVCPGRSAALGVVLFELDEQDVQQVRGMKTVALPAHHESCCRDILVEGICFVLPEETSLAAGGCSGERRFRLKTCVCYLDAAGICE